MLTRSQVAKRLGKSIATVRRLEGSLLHPCRDRDGVHRFDVHEVDALKNGRGPIALDPWRPEQLTESFEGGDEYPEHSPPERDREVDDARRAERVVRDQLEMAESRISELVERAAALGAENELLQHALTEGFFAWFESRSEKQIKQLALGGVDELLALLAGLQRASRPRKPTVIRNSSRRSLA